MMDEENLVRDYQAGMSMTRLRAKYFTSFRVLRRVLRAAGVYDPDRGKPAPAVDRLGPIQQPGHPTPDEIAARAAAMRRTWCDEQGVLCCTPLADFPRSAPALLQHEIRLLRRRT